MSLQSLHEVTFNTFLKNKSYDDIKRHVNVFLDKYLVKLFYMPAVLRLQKAISENHYITIYSSSPFFLVGPIADLLKVNEYKSSLYSLNNHNKFEKIKLILDGEKKASYALELMKKLNISKEEVYVYSDSIEDLSLFEISGNKIAVQPGKSLKKIFIENGWEII
jgi:phosphoserine phosphatase